MPRPKRNVAKDNWDIETPEITSKIVIKLLDAKMPTDSGLTNNQVRAAIRETRAKLNEIINVLNIR